MILLLGLESGLLSLRRLEKSKGDTVLIAILCAVLFGAMVHDVPVVDACLDGGGRQHASSGKCRG